jgi:hypothetical protein
VNECVGSSARKETAMLRRSCLAALLIVIGCPARSDFNVARWERYSPIQSSAGASAKYAEVSLNRDVYAGSTRGLSDLRVIADGSREIPYKLLVDEGEVADTPYQAGIQDKSTVPGKYNSFVLDLGKPGALSNRVEIQTSGKNFTRKVEIDGGNDAVNWAVLRSDGYIFDFSRDYYARSTSVTYPDCSYRYIRVKIWNYDEKPISVDGATVYRRKVQRPREEVFFQGTGAISQNQEEKSTDAELDLGASGFPVGRLVITSPDTNYNRQVEIAGSNDRKQWSDVCSGQILRYDTPKFKGAESSVSCDGVGYRYLRVRIRNYDDQPITISNIKVYGFRHRIFFPFQSGVSYRVYYGNEEATSPVYDIEAAFKYLASEKPVELALGPGVKNASFVRPIGTKTWLEENPWILWAVLLAAVALLGLLVVRSIIATKEGPPT